MSIKRKVIKKIILFFKINPVITIEMTIDDLKYNYLKIVLIITNNKSPSLEDVKKILNLKQAQAFHYLREYRSEIQKTRG